MLPRTCLSQDSVTVSSLLPLQVLEVRLSGEHLCLLSHSAGPNPALLKCAIEWRLVAFRCTLRSRTFSFSVDTELLEVGRKALCDFPLLEVLRKYELNNFCPYIPWTTG